LAQPLATSMAIEEINMKSIVITAKSHHSLGFIDRLVNWLSSRIYQKLVVVFCAIAIALTGCVKYDTGINFYSLNYGEIVEHIQLSEQINSFSQKAVQTWIGTIEQRTKKAQGKVERLSDRELKIVIPFNNSRDLTKKIDQYFNLSQANPEQRSQLGTKININQSNFLLFVRNHLTYDIDLRSILIPATDPKVAVTSSTTAIDLNFSLSSPWGIKIGDVGRQSLGTKMTQAGRANWQLQAGQLNHIDAIFWLPNPLGIGAMIIILVSTIGYYLKYRQLPGQPTPDRQMLTSTNIDNIKRI
jgi:Protein of unknown function (DUF3153)